jgi:outer membrane receptor protein involved in Fe transport
MDLAALLFALSLRVIDSQRPRITDFVIVLDEEGIPTAGANLDAGELATAPAATVDDILRSTPGFSLFRRSSSRVANPTTQGVTLRGLAASGSSRAVVLGDDIPLNDPVGGWVNWNRIPIVALQEVSVRRGASGDVFGVDAMGGVVTLRTKTTPGMRLLAEGGSDETGRVSGFLGRSFTSVDLFGSAEAFTTDGYVIAAPEARGPVDTRASSQSQAVHVASALRALGVLTTVRTTYYDESRGNGTPLQRNGTELGQISASVTRPGSRSTTWTGRAHAAKQTYEQTFSAVADDRASERLTSEQEVEATSIGASGDWVWSSGARALTVSGMTRYVDSTLEDAFSLAGVRLPPRIITPDQLTASLAIRGAASAPRWTAGGAVRGELWRTSLAETNSRTFLSPRLWAAGDVGAGVMVSAQVQSGHRGPTINELYRPFRVGSVVTDANAALRPESVRGLEGRVSWRRGDSTVSAVGFWSRVDDAIVNVTLSSQGSTIVRQRQNAARIVAAGVELEAELRAASWLSVSGSTSFTDSTFTAGPLADLRVPQVPRWHHAVGARATGARFVASVEWRYIGEQFDDDRNLFPLDQSSMTDARLGWRVTRRVELFAAIENAFDEEQDVGRTPLRTIGLPRTSRAGIRVGF